MSTINDLIKAIRETILLADKVERVGKTLDELGKESRHQGDRLTRVEAQLDLIIKMSGRHNHEASRQIT